MPLDILSEYIDIERKTLLEHTACGNIDSVDNFLVEGGLLCPKCNKELLEAGVDYQKLGAWFQCSQCGKRSDMPSPIHRCRNCGRIFTIRDTGFVNIYAYRLGSEAEEEFKRSYLIMKPIGVVLEDFQFKVEMPGQIAGRSGTLHRFDAVAIQSTERECPSVWISWAIHSVATAWLPKKLLRDLQSSEVRPQKFKNCKYSGWRYQERPWVYLTTDRLEDG